MPSEAGKVSSWRILHVVEVLGGGVWDAVHQYVHNLPEHEHLVLGIDAEYLPRFGADAKVVHLTGGLLARRRRMRELVEEFQPDVIHAHSSWAGVTCRLARVGGTPIVYQPHAFYFSKSTSPEQRLIAWLVEFALAFRTAGFIALSTHEAEQVARLAKRAPIFLVHNTSRLTSAGLRAGRIGFKVAMSGRIAAQKSPELFVAIANRVRGGIPGAEFVWLGDGEDRDRTSLESHGIRVSGWLEPDELAAELEEAHVYLHTSWYEGFPLSILDAAVVGLPLLVRDRPYSRDLDVEKFADAEQAAAIITQWHERPNDLATQAARSRAINSEFSVAAQREELQVAYRAVVRTNC